MKLNVDLEQARHYLQQLDLTYIIDAMCAESYPLPRWTREDAIQCATLYKNFLLLQKKHSAENLVPSRHIDEFWHNHILYTKNYSHDCMNIFGHYLHHQPAAPEEDQKQLVDDYLKTKKYYFDEFGYDLASIGGLAQS